MFKILDFMVIFIHSETKKNEILEVKITKSDPFRNQKPKNRKSEIVIL